MGFYAVVVVVVLTVAPNQILEFSPHFDSTNLHVVVVAVVFSSISKKETIHHVEANHDDYEYIEDENGLVPTALSSNTKHVTCSFDLFGKQSTGHAHGFFYVLIAQGFLSSFGNFLFDDLFGSSFNTPYQACF